MAEFLEQVLGEEDPVITPEPEPIVPEPEPVVEQAVEAAPEPAAPAVEAPAEPAQPQPGYVPISALMDERDKRKAAEARAQQYAPQQQSQAIPDPLDDPQGYNSFLSQQLEARIVQERFAMSDIMARQAHGGDKVDAAVSWAQERANSDPVFAASYMREANPVDWIVQQHARSERDAALGNASLDDWFVAEAAKRGYALQGAPVAAAPIMPAAQPAPRPAAPPRSIASDVSASAPVATDLKAEFEAIFNGR